MPSPVFLLGQTITSDLLSGLSIVVNVLVTIGLFYVGSKARKIDSLEASLRNATQSLVEQRLASCRAEHGLRHGEQEKSIAAILGRLERGENHFSRLEEKGHKAQLDMLGRLAELREVVATKDDLDRLRQEIHREHA